MDMFKWKTAMPFGKTKKDVETNQGTRFNGIDSKKGGMLKLLLGQWQNHKKKPYLLPVDGDRNFDETISRTNPIFIDESENSQILKSAYRQLVNGNQSSDADYEDIVNSTSNEVAHRTNNEPVFKKKVPISWLFSNFDPENEELSEGKKETEVLQVLDNAIASSDDSKPGLSTDKDGINEEVKSSVIKDNLVINKQDNELVSDAVSDNDSLSEVESRHEKEDFVSKTPEKSVTELVGTELRRKSLESINNIETDQDPVILENKFEEKEVTKIGKLKFEDVLQFEKPQLEPHISTKEADQTEEMAIKKTIKVRARAIEELMKKFQSTESTSDDMKPNKISDMKSNKMESQSKGFTSNTKKTDQITEKPPFIKPKSTSVIQEMKPIDNRILDDTIIIRKDTEPQIKTIKSDQRTMPPILKHADSFKQIVDKRKNSIDRSDQVEVKSSQSSTNSNERTKKIQSYSPSIPVGGLFQTKDATSSTKQSEQTVTTTSSAVKSDDIRNNSLTRTMKDEKKSFSKQRHSGQEEGSSESLTKTIESTSSFSKPSFKNPEQMPKLKNLGMDSAEKLSKGSISSILKKPNTSALFADELNDSIEDNILEKESIHDSSAYDSITRKDQTASNTENGTDILKNGLFNSVKDKETKEPFPKRSHNRYSSHFKHMKKDASGSSKRHYDNLYGKLNKDGKSLHRQHKRPESWASDMTFDEFIDRENFARWKHHDKLQHWKHRRDSVRSSFRMHSNHLRNSLIYKDPHYLNRAYLDNIVGHAIIVNPHGLKGKRASISDISSLVYLENPADYEFPNCTCEECTHNALQRNMAGRSSLRSTSSTWHDNFCTCGSPPLFVPNGRKVKFADRPAMSTKNSELSKTDELPESDSESQAGAIEPPGETKISEGENESKLTIKSIKEVMSKANSTGEQKIALHPWEVEQLDMLLRHNLLMKRRRRAMCMGVTALVLIIFVGLVVGIVMVYLRRKSL